MSLQSAKGRCVGFKVSPYQWGHHCGARTASNQDLVEWQPGSAQGVATRLAVIERRGRAWGYMV